MPLLLSLFAIGVDALVVITRDSAVKYTTFLLFGAVELAQVNKRCRVCGFARVGAGGVRLPVAMDRLTADDDVMAVAGIDTRAQLLFFGVAADHRFQVGWAVFTVDQFDEVGVHGVAQLLLEAPAGVAGFPGAELGGAGLGRRFRFPLFEGEQFGLGLVRKARGKQVKGKVGIGGWHWLNGSLVQITLARCR